MLGDLVELACWSPETFKGSTTEKKRKLINLVFGNLELKDGKLNCRLRPPFDAFVKCTKLEEWRTLVDDYRTSDKSFKDNIALFYIKQNYNDKSTIC